MSSNGRLDPISAAAAQVIASDVELRNEFRDLIKALLADAWRIVELGKPADRIALMKTVIPQMMRSMTGADANAGEAAIKATFEKLMREMRGEG